MPLKFGFLKYLIFEILIDFYLFSFNKLSCSNNASSCQVAVTRVCLHTMRTRFERSKDNLALIYYKKHNRKCAKKFRILCTLVRGGGSFDTFA